MRKFLFYFPLIVAVHTAAANDPVPATSGYTVTVDVTVNAEGKAEGVRVVHSDYFDLGEMAPHFARAMKFEPQVRDGVPIASIQRVPLFFPVDGDGGEEAGKRPVAQLRRPTQPDYPRALRYSGTPGGAIFLLKVDAQGGVREVSTVRTSHAEFARTGAAALKQWKFTPPKVDGKSVATEFHLAMAFEIEGRRPEWKWYVAPRPALPAAFVVGGAMVR